MNERATENNLSREEFEQLLASYIDTIIDSMSVEDLQVYVTNDMEDFCNKLTEHDLIEEIKYTLDEEFLEEFVTEIKGQSEGKNV